MKAKPRGSFKGVATDQDGTELKIEALSGVDKIILESPPSVDPAATDIFYSGGPLVTPIRDAIKAHLDGETVYAGKNRVPQPASSLTSTVGLEVLARGIGPANPGGKYNTDGNVWVGGILRNVLGQIAIYKAGVRDWNVVAPAADYEAADYAFPNDASIGLVTPKSVLIRGAT